MVTSLVRLKKQKERGIVLTELMFALPILLMLLFAIYSVFFLSLKAVARQRCATELSEQMRLALERMNLHLSTATRVKADKGNLEIERVLTDKGPNGEASRMQYTWPAYTPTGMYALGKREMKSRVPLQPMTGGNNLLADVEIKKFDVYEKHSVVFVELTGIEKFSNRELTFKSGVYIHQGGADERMAELQAYWDDMRRRMRGH